MLNIEFIDWTKQIYDVHPICKAAAVAGAYKEAQKEKHGYVTFHDCPGILDFKNNGYILKAWQDFEIYSSRESTMCYVSGRKGPTRDSITKLPMPNPGAMSSDITDFIPGAEVDRLVPLHFESPWTVKADCSVLTLPPSYHSNIVDDFMIYPGVVDYCAGFTTMNVIMSPKKYGTFKIAAGTPLLHIVPFEKQTINAVFGPSSLDKKFGIENSRHFSSAKQWYRKYIMRKSKFNLTKVFKDTVE
ncbi:MAG TPA: hypothetical protein DCW83_01510 [Saprospirales bacterium]|nr:hypothetical protein [Saprospirales bacterium]